jgi:hypothetical protein
MRAGASARSACGKGKIRAVRLPCRGYFHEARSARFEPKSRCSVSSWALLSLDRVPLLNGPANTGASGLLDHAVRVVRLPWQKLNAYITHSIKGLAVRELVPASHGVS